MLRPLTEDHLLIQNSIREFAEKELLPGVIERDKNAIHPTEQLKAMADLGLMGMMVSPDYGGSGLDTMSYVLAMMEISKIDNSCSVAMSVNNSLVCWTLEHYGSETIKQEFLPRLASGEMIGGFCLSEPEAGSDATSLKTTAEDKGDHYILNGTKNWITNGYTAGAFVVFAQSNPERGSRGINAFVIDANLPGITRGPKEDKLGIRSSDTCAIMFKDVIVPKENRLQKEGDGFVIAMKTLSGGRIGIASQAVGISMGAYERSLQYAQERMTFGVPIIQHQGVSFKLADMATAIEAAKLLVFQAAQDKDDHKDYTLSSSMAKLFAAENAMKITTEAVQIHGGYGYVREYHVERLMRDAKITQIYEGTSEIQKIVISRAISRS